MSKSTDELDSYPLFYEELSRSRQQASKGAKRDGTFDHVPGLSEDQIAKLSDDLNTPLEPTDSNPMQ